PWPRLCPRSDPPLEILRQRLNASKRRQLLRPAINAIDRVEVQALVVAAVALVEEIEAGKWIARESRIFECLPEGGIQRGIVSQNVAGYRFGDVGLHVFLALEGVVEMSPGRQRVGEGGFQQGHCQ